jgi:hypothetical protein
MAKVRGGRRTIGGAPRTTRRWATEHATKFNLIRDPLCTVLREGRIRSPASTLRAPAPSTHPRPAGGCNSLPRISGCVICAVCSVLTRKAVRCTQTRKWRKALVKLGQLVIPRWIPGKYLASCCCSFSSLLIVFTERDVRIKLAYFTVRDCMVCIAEAYSGAAEPEASTAGHGAPTRRHRSQKPQAYGGQARAPTGALVLRTWSLIRILAQILEAVDFGHDQASS